jgi:HK97 family phage major capsid protein/HK97 family phage prohead protease
MPKSIHQRNIGKLPEGFKPGDAGTRVMAVENVDKEKRTLELSFSSEVEVKRYGMVEILDHSNGAVDLSRLNNGGPLLFNHDLDKVIGVIERAYLDGTGKGRALVRFSKREDAEEVWQDIQDGILKNVSVGYRINEIKLKESRDDGSDVYLVTKWEPYEISIVSAPADPSVGVGRNMKPETNSQTRKTNLMNKEQMISWLAARGIQVSADIADAELVRMVTEYKPATPAADPTEIAARAQRSIQVGEDHSRGANEERNRVSAILAAGEQYSQRDLAQKAVKEGKTLDAFRGELLDAVNHRNQQVRESNGNVGLSDQEARGFSFLKLFRALTAPAGEAKRYAEEAKFELEACAAAADKMTHRSVKGVLIPVDVMTAALPGLGQRGTDIVSIKTGSGYSGTGGNTVQTQLLASSFIDILRNRTTIMQLGTELGGLVGNVDIPRQTTGASASWIGEDVDSTQEDIDFDLVSLRPKTVTNFMEVTRKMLMQSSLGMEALLRRQMAQGIAQQIDLKGYYGTGTSDTPTGIKATSGINSFYWATANTPLFTEFVRAETELASDNADVQSMAYVTNPVIRGYAKGARKIATSTDSNTIWEPGNTINGYRTEITNQIATGDAFFGNFADLWIGLWGGLDITVDPYTNSKKGRIRIVGFQDIDFAVRRAASFCYMGNNPA